MKTLRFGLFAVLLAACATPGPSGKAANTTPSAATPGAEEPASEDGLIPPEKVDELTQFFNGKNSTVARCITAPEGDKKRVPVKMTVALTVKADGTPSDVKVSQATGADEALKGCVVGLVQGWALPAPGQDMEFSHGYAFEAE